MKPSPFDYHDPESIDAALELMQTLPNAKIIAGGQSLMAMLNFRFLQPDHLIDLRRIPELTHIEEQDDKIRIGAMVRQRELEHSAVIAKNHPLMGLALEHVGHIQTRNRGTIGGSLCHLDPAAELPVVALALDGEVWVRGAQGDYSLKMPEFALAYMMPNIAPEDFVTAICFPRPSNRRGSAFREFARRHGDFAIVSVAVVIDVDKTDRIVKVRLAVGGAGSVPQRGKEFEAALEGINLSDVPSETLPGSLDDLEYIADSYYSADYRRRLTRTLCRRALDDILNDLEICK